MKRGARFLIFLLLLLLLTLLASCGGAAGEDVLSACLGPDPGRIDPASTDPAQQTYALHLFEGLMKYVPDDRPAGDDPSVLAARVVCGQAAAYEFSEDGLSCTFHLREDIYWSDGQPVTAADFVYAWRRLADPGQELISGRLLCGVVENAASILAGEMEPDRLGVEAADDSTLTVRLERADCDILRLCAHPALSPLRQEQAEAEGGAVSTFLSNGPYALTKWAEGRYIRLSRNQYYYEHEEYEAEASGPRELVFYFREREEDILSLYTAGRLRFIQGFPTAEAARLTASGDCFSLPRAGLSLLEFSCAALPDWRVRAALALAIERQAITDDLLQGGQRVARGLLGAGLTLSGGTGLGQTGGEAVFSTLSAAYPESDLDSYEGRCTLSRQLLQEAKADGFDGSVALRLVARDLPTQAAVLRQAAEDISDALGLTAELYLLDREGLDQALRQGDFDIALLSLAPARQEATYYLGMFGASSGYNYSGWLSPTYDRLLADLAQSRGEERDLLLMQAEQTLFGPWAYPCLPLYEWAAQYCGSGLRGVVYAPEAGFLFTYASLTGAEGDLDEVDLDVDPDVD